MFPEIVNWHSFLRVGRLAVAAELRFARYRAKTVVCLGWIGAAKGQGRMDEAGYCVLTSIIGGNN